MENTFWNPLPCAWATNPAIQEGREKTRLPPPPHTGMGGEGRVARGRKRQPPSPPPPPIPLSGKKGTPQALPEYSDSTQLPSIPPFLSFPFPLPLPHPPPPDVEWFSAYRTPVSLSSFRVKNHIESRTFPPSVLAVPPPPISPPPPRIPSPSLCCPGGFVIVKKKSLIGAAEAVCCGVEKSAKKSKEKKIARTNKNKAK